MAKRPLDKGWLGPLVDSELERWDAGAALSRLPDEIRRAGESATDLAPPARLLVARSLRHRPLDSGRPAPAAEFLEVVRVHVGLLLDLGALRGEPFERARRRAEIAAFLAAAVGEYETAIDAHPAEGGGVRAVARALRSSETALEAQLFPPGDPLDGLPLHPGHVAIQRRRLARVAMGHHRAGRLHSAALARHAEYAMTESVLHAETLAGLVAASAPPDARSLAVRQKQLARLGLSGRWLREARRAVASPRAPGAVAAAAPERVRPFLMEQLFLAVLRAKLAGDGPARFVEAFGAASGLDPAALASAQIEAAAQHGDHQVWFGALDGGDGGISWQSIADEWNAATDQIVERVSSAVTDNLEAMATEIRQTGELGTLLARAAAGGTLTADEKRKVRHQLVDLAKAVPALAIFAAPGGLLLLPLLAKLLPFNVLPSAWDKVGERSREGKTPSAVGAAKPTRRGRTRPARGDRES